MKPSSLRLEVEQLATTFRVNPVNAPILAHCDTWNLIEKVGGRAAIIYGMFRATPIRSRWKRQDYQYDIATALDEAATKL